nr:prepilin-type N-terminal cleavage/methylation domain-containing protein [Desulfobacterales bacterium]
MSLRLVFRKQGYTLIEITTVVFLIGLLILVTIPRFREGILTDGLKLTVRKIVGTAKNLRNVAVLDQKDYLLCFDLESNRLWTMLLTASPEERYQGEKNAFQLPDDVKILDIVHPGMDKDTTGYATIRFFKKGYVQPTVIHLGAKDGREFSVILSPFLWKVKVYDRYVDM